MLHPSFQSVEGEALEGGRVEIFDLAGRSIFDSGMVGGDAFTWNLMSSQGEVLANGVYLYVVTVKGWDGQILRSEVRKLVILR